MSMMRLLAAGKSLAGLKNPGARYRMTNPRALPKFGSANNPFHSKAKPEAAPAKVAGAAATDHESCSTPAQPATATKDVHSPQPSVARNHSATTPAPLQSGLAEKLRRLFEPRVRPAKSGLSRFVKQPVQAELTLDNIRVVRNDLSDADLEVVPVKPAIEPSGKQKPVRARWFKPELTGLAWSRLTARLFNSQRLRA